jgi:hypothetical protein
MNPDIDPDDGMISRSALAKETLLYRMKQMSDDFFCASWLSDLEFIVWDMTFGKQQSFAGVDVTDEMAKSFRDLAILSDGWWIWDDDADPSEENPVFITMKRWKEILENKDRSDPEKI